VDQLAKDARRLTTIGTFFIWAGWVFVIYAAVAGVLWWVSLAQRAAFDILEALAVSAAAVGLPLFSALVVVAIGYALRLFASYVAAKSQ
jgi:hypothetical protein